MNKQKLEMLNDSIILTQNIKKQNEAIDSLNKSLKKTKTIIETLN